MLSPEELDSLRALPEGDVVERKESAGDLDRIRQAICAYANDLPNHRQPGYVLIGVTDRGATAGLQADDRLLRTLSGLRDDGGIQPFPRMEVGRYAGQGGDIVVIKVFPSDNTPVRCDGVVWIRVGPRRARATPEEERVLVEKRRLANLPFDQRPILGATIADLDEIRFKSEYLPAAVPSEVLEENQRSTVEQLKSLRFLTVDQVPTAVGMLLAGIEPRRWLPGAYIQFARFDGTAVTDPIKSQHEVSGTLIDQLRLIEEIFLANVSTSSKFEDGIEERIPDYPILALQELIRNAVIHRNYEATNTPVRVSWYSDRIEFISPGGPFGQVSIENFGQPGITDYRNPGIAEALKNVGYAQKFGRGIAIARSQLAKNGNPELAFNVLPSHILAVVRARA